MNFHVLTLFPDMVKDGLYTSILKRAMDNGLISLNTVNIRDYTLDKHKKTDDYPFGGGAGLLMQADPVFRAYEAVTESIAARNASTQTAEAENASTQTAEASDGRKVRTIYLSPQGRTFSQRMAEELSKEENLVFLCGHYEGIDERALEEIVTDTVSMGDFVLTGGELAAMMMIDAISRLIPGVLHNDFSAKDESFSGYLLEYPQYTRPEIWHGKRVPEELLSGDHKKIREWRQKKAEERTKERRPDLYAGYLELQSCKEMLMKNKLLYRDMIETIDRGVAKLIYKEEGTVLLYNRAGEACQLMAKDAEAGKRALAALTEAPDAIISHEPFMDEVLRDFVCKDGTAYEMCPPCVQMSYTRKELLQAPKSDIRLLTEDYAEIIDENYDLLSIDGIREHLREGKLFGIFEGEVLAGFAGEHSDGSMGMLFVFPKYRGKGYAMELERFLINETVKRGDTPYCQIFFDNEASLKLQEKLSLYAAKGNIRWFVKK